MNRPIKYILFIIIISFSFIFSVNAECSYKERKELLSSTNNVDISIEPVLKDDYYEFKFNIVGMSDNLFIKYYNTNNGSIGTIFYSDLKEGVYSFIDGNPYMVYSYKFIFYSANDKCPGYEIKTKTIKKPMYNRYSNEEACNEEVLKNFKYCKKFTTVDYKLTKEKFYESMYKYQDKLLEKYSEDEEENNKSFLRKYLIYILLLIIIIASLITGFILYRKKKNEL